ncbi:MAG: TatD family hydrolase [Syntrophobacterales bacterium]|jgi:TatD DNase family protein|nr:TatD family hydrolase [Syntrophobacterales bacterium]
MLIDSHAHLELDEFDRDREEAINRARQEGLEAILVVGINLDDSRRAVELANQHDMLFAAVGTHPHDVKKINLQTYDRMAELARDKKVVAYGEIGLDFFRNRSPKDVQIRRFGEQLELAQTLNLPVIIHDRDAHKETTAILKNWKGEKRGVIHCFSGDYAMAKQCLDLGFYISIPATVTYPKAEELREVVKKIPLNAILIETDCPFLPPQIYRGKRNEPAYVSHVARKIAAVKNAAPADVESQTTANARHLFSLH